MGTRTQVKVVRDAKKEEEVREKAKARLKKKTTKPKQITARTIAVFDRFQKEIISAYRGGATSVQIKGLLEGHNIKLSETSINAYITHLEKLGKLKKRPKGVSYKGQRGPTETTLFKLDPHRKKIIDFVRRKESLPYIIKWLAKRGSIVNNNTLRNYIEWVKSQRGK